MRRRISMRKIKEVLRLIHHSKVSQSQTAKICSISRATVQEYLMRASAAGIKWPVSQEMSDAELEAKLYPESKTKVKDTLDFEYLITELKRPNVTKQLLWEAYKQGNPDGYQYTRFCILINDYLKTKNYSMRQIHKAGEKAFVDFGDGLYIIDINTGELTQTQLFVMTWGASNYSFAKASLGQNLENWINLNTDALIYFGCCPKAIVPDNLKSGVKKACIYEPEINPTYAEFADHYNIVIFPPRPGKPKDKAKVETSVRIAKQWVLARLRNHIFTSLAQMNEKIAELMEDFNNRTMKQNGKTRCELFFELDKPNALPLPEEHFEFAEYKEAKVNIDYHVSFDKHNYSVPYQFVGKKVDIRAAAKTIEVLYKGKRIASHKRSYKKGGYETLKEHMPPSHQKYAEWTPKRIMSWAEKYGSNVRELVELIMLGHIFPEQGYRACLGIIRLANRFTSERLDAACARALKYNALSYKSVKNILVKELDKKNEFSTTSSTPKDHENIRGAAYYNKSINKEGDKKEKVYKNRILRKS